jgi:hypothetical protein
MNTSEFKIKVPKKKCENFEILKEKKCGKKLLSAKSKAE